LASVISRRRAPVISSMIVRANETLSLLAAQETLPVGLGCGGNTGCGVHGGSGHFPFAGQIEQVREERQDTVCRSRRS
jgi:hypothetical protein